MLRDHRDRLRSAYHKLPGPYDPIGTIVVYPLENWKDVYYAVANSGFELTNPRETIVLGEYEVEGWVSRSHTPIPVQVSIPGTTQSPEPTLAMFTAEEVVDMSNVGGSAEPTDEVIQLPIWGIPTEIPREFFADH